jgi:hypothetical protein
MEHAVPLDCEAIGQLQNSALALDVYSWLAHRLWRVREGNGVDLSWAALKAQFGQEYRDIKNFKKEFIAALKKAGQVYEDARLEMVPGGIKLFPSPPPVKRMAVRVTAPETDAGAHEASIRALPGPQPFPLPGHAGKRKVVGVDAIRKTSAVALPVAGGVIVEKLVSEKALEQVPAIAPGLDKYALAETYKAWVLGKGEMPRHPDAAFLGWVRKYTKNIRI